VDLPPHDQAPVGMGKLVAALVIATALGAAVLFVAGGRPMNEPQAHELTDEEKREYHRYLMANDCSGLVSTECKPLLTREAWVRAWREAAERGVEPELASHEANQTHKRSWRQKTYEGYLLSQICMTGPHFAQKGGRYSNPCKPLSREEWEQQRSGATPKRADTDDPLFGLDSLSEEAEQERRRAAAAEAESALLKALEVERRDAEIERLRQSKRRARTKSKSTQRQAEPPHALGITPDDPLGDLVLDL